MAYEIPKQDPAVSVLKMEHIIFDELSFVRQGFQTDDDKNFNLELSVSIQNLNNGGHRVSLTATAIKTDEFTAKVRISAYCYFDAESAQNETILKRNVAAILLPYVRAELTLLTAQPETEPIVLPAFNVNAMFEKEQLTGAAQASGNRES